MAAEKAVKPSGHPRIPNQRIGVLLVNLGTPDATDYWSMRRYLGEFLSDRRVIELSPWLWQPILQGVILSLRPTRSGRAYDTIWNREADESPLRTITRAQTEKLAARLTMELPGLAVDWAMRYGQPSIAERIAALEALGCRRLLLFPLYPQYSATTTATACDAAFRALMGLRWQPALRTAPAYHDAPGYIDALAGSVEEALAGLDWTPEVLLASFHGLPQSYLAKGDPYHCQCQKTARLLREKLSWEEARLQISFQSRVGRQEWLRPYSDETVQRLAAEGIKDLAIVAPGFAADCLETLEEIAFGLRESFLAAGGRNFAYIPCLNDRDDHIELLAGLVRRELAGWI
jgi:ferrochelatase